LYLSRNETAIIGKDKYIEKINNAQMINDDLKRRLKNAVIRGINEGFDIEDLGNEIEELKPAKKKKVTKHSKMYGEMKKFISKGYDFDLGNFNYYSMRRFVYDNRSFEGLDVLKQIAYEFNHFDTETQGLIRKHGLDKVAETFVMFYEAFYIAESLTNWRTKLTSFQRLAYNKYMSKITDNDHPLYAFYPASKHGLEMIISNVTPKMNLNWIDVSGIDDLSDIHWRKPWMQFNGDISLWDVSDVTKMDFLFEDNHAFNGDISKWDVSNVTSMRGMFKNSVFNGDISNWDVSSVTNMSSMFHNASFNGDISGWNVSNVKNMAYMFASSYSYSHVPHNEKCGFCGDISGWDVSNVIDFENMFERSSVRCDISGWKLDKAKNVSNMFLNAEMGDCDLSGWRLPEATDFEYMFCGVDIKFDMSGWIFTKAENMRLMFFRAKLGKKVGDISHWEFPAAKDMEQMFNGATLDNKLTDWTYPDDARLNALFAYTDFQSDPEIYNWQWNGRDVNARHIPAVKLL